MVVLIGKVIFMLIFQNDISDLIKLEKIFLKEVGIVVFIEIIIFLGERRFQFIFVIDFIM